MNYVVALVVTVAVEAPLYGVGLPRVGDVDPRRATVAGVLVNLASHPLAWLAAWPLLRTAMGPMPAFVAVEALVAVGECAVLRRWRRFDVPMLAGLVLAANAASVAVGAVLSPV